MNIGIDMLGGDFAPLEAEAGVLQFLAQYPSARLTLVGSEALTQHFVQQLSTSITLIPSLAVSSAQQSLSKRHRKGSFDSLLVGFELLSSGAIDALVSAGDTGEILKHALTDLPPFSNVLRPAMGVVIPKEGGASGLLLDVGLNADCRPEHLNQFAGLGTRYAQTMLGIKAPRVALLNIGEEREKGNRLAQSAHRLLQQNGNINFIGNIEGGDVFSNKADVLVCDGFTGNIVLKLGESLFRMATQKGIENPWLHQLNFEMQGGAPVLGISKPVVVGHGISNRLAFSNMILLAQKMLEKGVVEKLSAEL